MACRAVCKLLVLVLDTGGRQESRLWRENSRRSRSYSGEDWFCLALFDGFDELQDFPGVEGNDVHLSIQIFREAGNGFAGVGK